MRKKEVLAQELLGLKSPIFASFGGRAILVTSSRREARHVVPTSEDRGCVSLRKEVPIRNLRLKARSDLCESHCVIRMRKTENNQGKLTNCVKRRIRKVSICCVLRMRTKKST